MNPTGTYKHHGDIVALTPDVPVFDWRIKLDLAIRDFAQCSRDIADALNAGGERAAYVRANARQFDAHDLLQLQLVCSVITAMAELSHRLEAAE